MLCIYLINIKYIYSILSIIYTRLYLKLALTYVFMSLVIRYYIFIMSEFSLKIKHLIYVI